MYKKLIVVLIALLLIGASAGTLMLWQIERDLPQMLKLEDYKPLLISDVYARGGEKIGEFFREARILTPYEKIPKHVVQPFLAAEDDKFFQHKGLNYQAIFRAALANMLAGRTAQGASTITQQVAKTLLLRNNEKTLLRKIREAMLAFKLEESLRKEDILYLYLNQIFFGAQSYGVAAAAQTYYRKPLDQVTIAEAALLAGLPKAPTDYSPIKNPQAAKDRQRYVLSRMVDVGFLTRQEADKALAEPIKIYLHREYNQVAPFFVETVRQLLVHELGESTVLDGGIKVHTSLDYKAQLDAQVQVQEGLKAVDKRQGYRGPLKHLEKPDEIRAFLLETRNRLEKEKAPVRVITKDGNVVPERPLELYKKINANASGLPDYIKLGKNVEAVVTEVIDKFGLAKVRFAESEGLLDVGDMGWARKPDSDVSSDVAPRVTKPSAILKKGDVVLVKVEAEKFMSERLTKELAAAKKKGPSGAEKMAGLPSFDDYAYVTLDQEPLTEGALLSFDQKTEDVVAMIGGFDYERSKYNRALQANRQTGSAFKAIIYLAALDKGWSPGRIVADAPIVFDRDSESSEGQDDKKKPNEKNNGNKNGNKKDEKADEPKKWKPHNYGNRFEGDVLFRQALIQSLNIPTVKILEDIGISWAVDYSRRLGVFSPLNQDLSLSLGSSGVTLYEMTKVFSHIGRLGRRIHPIVVHNIVDPNGKEIRGPMTLDQRFQNEIAAVDKYFEEKRKKVSEQGGLLDLDDAEPGTAPDPTKPQETAAGGTAAAAASGAAADANKPPVKQGPKLYFQDPNQLIHPATAYLATNMLASTITDENGTAARARALGRPAAGKTGTTSGYYDTWFVGYTPQYVTGVWVGFDQEKSMGTGEAGGRTALPIWLEYMKNLHQNIPPVGFSVPDGIVFVNIDKKTGKLASAKSREVVYQAFLRGTEPTEMSEGTSTKDDADFYKEDLTE